MKKINKKGFTMVELLTVIVIIGVISTLAIVGVSKVIQNAHKKYNLSQAKLFISAAQTYFTDNKSKLPTRTFTSSKVTLQTLIDQNYIKELVDYKKEPYVAEKSYAYVTKMGVGKYAYDGELLSKNDGPTKYKECDDGRFTIQFLDNKKVLNESETIYSNNDKKIEVQMTSSYDIAGYIISIYKGSKKLQDLEYKEIGNKKKVTTTISLTTDVFKDGRYKLKVKLIDIYNNQKNASTGTIVIDTIAPECKIIPTGTKGDNNWYTSNVKFKLQIREANKFTYAIGGVGRSTGSHNGADEIITITKTSNSSLTEFVQTDTSGVFWNATVTDLAGNKADCKYEDATTSKKIMVDTTSLSCDIVVKGESGNNSWYTSNVDLTLNYTKDGKSGVSYGISQTSTPDYNSKTSLTISDNTPGSNYYGYVKNGAGTTAKCSKTLKIDKTEPSIHLKYDGASGYWYQTSKNVTVDYYSTGVSGVASIKDIDGTYYSTSNLTKTYTPNVVKNEIFTITNGAGKSAQSNEIKILLDKRDPKLDVHGGTIEETKNYLYVSCSHVNPSINSLLGWNLNAQTKYCLNQEHLNNSEWIKLSDGSYKFKGALGCKYIISGKCGNVGLNYTAVDVSKTYYCYRSTVSADKNCLNEDNCHFNNETCCNIFAKKEGWDKCPDN